MNKKLIVLLAAVMLLISGSAMYHFLTVGSTDNNFERISAEVAQEKTSKKENIIVFYSSKECSACHMYAPILEDVASRLAIKVYQLTSKTEKTNASESDSENDFIKNYNLYSTPTLLLFKDGEVTRFEGILTEAETTQAINDWQK